MKKTHRNLFLRLSPVILAAIIAGCSLTIEPEAVQENINARDFKAKYAINKGEYCNLADRELYRKFYAPEWGDSCNLSDRAFYEKLAARQH